MSGWLSRALHAAVILNQGTTLAQLLRLAGPLRFNQSRELTSTASYLADHVKLYVCNKRDVCSHGAMSSQVMSNSEVNLVM
jgi:hypothetical protein